eukprot:CAMPEP_0115190228 /NCGR_PEP_ID=MMETSP0270-20121206/11917_1 /TAXON_ID=71861 /ORGANISM="Scrippsiella trochoidea, Strain CCMP3099" /LENGTH=355 /DNA_ID=CAMNT_0002603433 /DNA_START=74 /DNA_END=1138 /DNA_ORIENTATION=+
MAAFAGKVGDELAQHVSQQIVDTLRGAQRESHRERFSYQEQRREFEKLVQANLAEQSSHLYVFAVPLLVVEQERQRFEGPSCSLFALDDAGVDAAVQHAQQRAGNSRSRMLLVTFQPVSLKPAAFASVARLDLIGMPPWAPPPYDHLVSFEEPITLAPSSTAKYVSFNGGVYNHDPSSANVEVSSCRLRQLPGTLRGVSSRHCEVDDRFWSIAGTVVGTTGGVSVLAEGVAYLVGGGLWTLAFGPTHWGLGALAGTGLVAGGLTLALSGVTLPLVLWYMNSSSEESHADLSVGGHAQVASAEDSEALVVSAGLDADRVSTELDQASPAGDLDDARSTNAGADDAASEVSEQSWQG